MTASVKAFGWAGALALVSGAVLAVSPVLLVVLALAALLVWGLWTVQRLNYTLFALLFLVPVTANPGYPVDPVWVVLLAAVAVALFGRLQRFDPHAPIASVGLVAFALPVTCLVTGLVHWNEAHELAVGLVPLVAYAVITWHLVQEAHVDPGTPVRLARAFAWVGVPMAVLAIYQRVTGTWPVLDQLATAPAFTSSAGAGRSVGTVGHPIVYGTYCLVGMCAAVGLRGRLWQVPFAAGAVGLLLSGSRSAWIGVVCALAVWYLAQPRKVTRRGIGLIAAFLGIGGLLVVIGPKPVRSITGILTARLSNLTSSDSATARYRRTAEAMSGIRKSFGSFVFGQGPEAHVRFFEQIGINDGLAQTFDNSYLTLWYDYGLLPLVVFGVALLMLFLRFRSVTSRMIVVAFVVQIWFFDFYLWPAAAAALILAVGLAVGQGRVAAGARIQAAISALTVPLPIIPVPPEQRNEPDRP